MTVLAQCMALFWTLMEGVILIYLRWGYLRLANRPSAQRGFVYSCAAGFLLLGFVVFAGEGLVQEVREMRPTHLTLYRWVLWDFLCTLWVFLEGWIMVLVTGIFSLLSSSAAGEPPAKKLHRLRERFIPCVMGLILFGFLVWYSGGLIHTALRHEMEPRAIYRVAVFYVRICGILWIAFEWVVAIYGLRTWSLLKKMEEKG